MPPEAHASIQTSESRSQGGDVGMGDDLGWRVRKGLDRAGPLGHGHAKERGQHSQSSRLNALLIGPFI